MVNQVATNVFWHEGEVTRIQRNRHLNQKGATLWFTGLSGSGKSTLAVALERCLLERNKLAFRLDGDNIRLGINKNLGFSAEDRTENIRRVGEVSKLFAESGLICLSSFISPYQADREIVRRTHDAANLPFIEVFVDCTLDVVERRDPKGLYKKARCGEIKNFTGIDAPYETPNNPELHIRSDKLNLEDEVELVLKYLEKSGLLSA